MSVMSSSSLVTGVSSIIDFSQEAESSGRDSIIKTDLSQTETVAALQDLGISLKQPKSFLRSSVSPIPVQVLRNVIGFLSKKEINNLAQTNSKIAILVHFDPSKKLENMNIRSAKTAFCKPVPSQKTQGPSHLFLLQNPEHSEEVYKIKTIIAHMNKDPAVARTAKGIFDAEQNYSSCFPLYHAMNSLVFCYSLFTKELLSIAYENSQKLPCDNPLIRFPCLIGPTNVSEFFESFQLNSKYENRYDHDPAVQKELLSLNPHLFNNLMVDGESTWFMYYENKSTKPPDMNAFFDLLCNEFRIKLDTSKAQQYKEKLTSLLSELSNLPYQYTKYISDPSFRDEMSPKGIILQFLVPKHLANLICYPSKPYGELDKDLRPLSKNLEDISTNPRSHKNMQVRMLVQSLFVPKNGIQVFTHGCDNFFKVCQETIPNREQLAKNDLNRAIGTLNRRDEILKDARGMFREMFMQTIVPTFPNTCFSMNP